MGFSASSGSIVVTDGSGNTKFNTANNLFIPTNYVTGSTTLSDRSGNYLNDEFGGESWSVSDVDTSYTLATGLNSNANVVRGAVSITHASGYAAVNSNNYGYSFTPVGVVDRGYFNASGTILYAHIPEYSYSYGGIVIWGSFMALTFNVSGGTLSLHERSHVHGDWTGAAGFNSASYVTIRGPTLNYRLFVGTFV